jgi:hypothetical protein
VFKKLAAAGAMTVVMGGVILGSSPAQADGDDGLGPSCTTPCDNTGCAHSCKPKHWHWGWHSGNGNGSGNSVNQVIPIQLCDTLKDIGALIGVPLHNVTILGKSYNREDAVCINGPVSGSHH